jgi:hypothetical protein
MDKVHKPSDFEYVFYLVKIVEFELVEEKAIINTHRILERTTLLTDCVRRNHYEF